MRSYTWIPKLSIFLLSIVGFFIFRDYGISTDEQQSRLVGNISLSYIANLFKISFLLDGATPLQNPTDVFLNFKDRDYGVAFELPAELLIKIFQIESIANAYYFRHALTFLVFLGGVSAVYAIAKNRYADWRWGLVAASFLVFSPRIFGDAFYNDKDLVFMSLFVIGIYTLINLINNPSIKTAVLHALACAIAIDSRIMASIIPLATIFVIGIQILKRDKFNKQYLKLLPIYLIMLCLFIYIFWPWLWADPIKNFLEAFKNMSRFRWSGFMFFMGDIINGANVPWNYIPVWLSVTTPPVYLALFILGCMLTIKTIFQRRLALWGNLSELQDVVILGFFFAPLIAVISLHSILYNGWRHLYFIYPAFILVSIHGLYSLLIWAKPRLILQRIILISVSLSIVWTVTWMIRNHPYQYLYFNILAKNWVNNFDLDYWGVAYKSPLQKILNLHPGQTVVIFNDMDGKQAWGYWQIPYWENTFLFNKTDQERIDGKKSEQCSDFVITSIAGNANQYSQRKDFSLFDEIRVDGKLIYATYKRNIPISELQPKQNVAIYFSNIATQCFLKQGWAQYPEDWGVWSIRNETAIELPIPPGSSELKINARAFVNPKNPKQEVFITVGNEKPLSILLNKFDGNSINLVIPGSAKETGNLKLKIEIPKAESPRSLGISDDDRTLGIGLVSATFH
jgi:hypothetical protein